MTLPKGGATFNWLFTNYKWSAKTRDLIFTLTKEEFKYLTKQNCFYCNDEPSKSMPERFNGNCIYNGLDRKDNDIGYVMHNVVSCCWLCNSMKTNLSDTEFIEHCKKVSGTH